MSTLLINPYRFNDPYWANVVFLSSFEGPDGATSTTEDTGLTLSFTGGARIETDQFKFGAASLRLESGTPFVSAPSSDRWDFGSGDFTIEAWAWIGAAGVDGSGSRTVLSRWTAAGNQRAWDFDFGDNFLFFNIRPNGGTSPTPFAGDFVASSLNTWYHIAASRVGNELRVFRNGVQIGATGDMTGVVFPTFSVPLRLGCVFNTVNAVTNRFVGYIDEVRITKGVGRYTGNFDPPTAPFPRG